MPAELAEKRRQDIYKIQGDNSEKECILLIVSNALKDGAQQKRRQAAALPKSEQADAQRVLALR